MQLLPADSALQGNQNQPTPQECQNLEAQQLAAHVKPYCDVFKILYEGNAHTGTLNTHGPPTQKSTHYVTQTDDFNSFTIIHHFMQIILQHSVPTSLRALLQLFLLPAFSPSRPFRLCADLQYSLKFVSRSWFRI